MNIQGKKMSQIKIFDTESFFHFIENLSGVNDATWFFLGKDYGELKKIRLLLNNKIQELDISDIFQQSVNDVRESFVEYLACYAEGLPLCDQYSSLIERVPLKSDVFLNFCYLYCAKGAVEKCDKKQILIICQEPEVAWDLKQTLQDNDCTLVQIYTKYHPKKFLSLLSLARTFIKQVFPSVTSQSRALLFRHLNCIKKQNKQDFSGLYAGNTIFIHTWASESSFSTNGYKEIYYSDLSEKLAEKGFNSCTIIHLSFNNKIIEKNYFNCLKELNDTTQRFIPEESFINISSIVKIWKKCLFYHVSIDNHKLLNIDFTWCAFKQNYDDWKNCHLFYPLTTYYMIKGISEKKIPVRSIIILHENYNSEKTLIRAVRKFLPDTTIIGYQHIPISENFIMHHLSKKNFDQVNLPDYIITNGVSTSKFLKQHNYPQKKIIVGGALRYKKLNSIKNISKSKDCAKSNSVLVTLPIIFDETIEMLDKIFKAYADDQTITIWCKPHPFLPFATISKFLSKEILDRVIFTDKSLVTILPEMKMLLYSTSSSCIDSLIMNTPVLKIISDGRIDIDPLCNYRDTSKYITSARTPDEIREKTNMFFRTNFSHQDRAEVLQIIEEIFSDVSDETYSAFTKVK